MDNSLRIAVINGPNINMLGIREPGFYGKETWDEIEKDLRYLSGKMGVKMMFFQSNHEGFLVDFIQDHIKEIDGVIINPAAYTKNGYAILEALMLVRIPFVEVHLSNIYSRGGWHAESIFSEKAVGRIIGFKGSVYALGLKAIVNYIETARDHESISD